MRKELRGGVHQRQDVAAWWGGTVHQRQDVGAWWGGTRLGQSKPQAGRLESWTLDQFIPLSQSMISVRNSLSLSEPQFPLSKLDNGFECFFVTGPCPVL